MEVISPRISFSHDLKGIDYVPVEPTFLFKPTVDFDFCITPDVFSLSTADELFANGRIRPGELKRTDPFHGHHSAHKKTKQDPPRKKRSAAENINGEEERRGKLQPTSVGAATTKNFWQFRRSSSTRSDNGRTTRLLRSLQFLNRSNSTGSVKKPKPSNGMKIENSTNLDVCLPQRYGGSSPRNPSGRGIRVAPVLSIAPSCTGGMFGFGSLFSTKKSNKNREL